jgi:hypothetical protein
MTPEGVTVQPGGLYINDRTQILNIVDESDRKIYGYHLPVTAKSKPFRTLGPTGVNLNGDGTPSAGGFNKNGSKIALGDNGGWIDAGTIRTNSWKLLPNVNFAGGVLGAAYTPSDKMSSP